MAFTEDEQCEAIRMVAMGERISSKLKCRAWAKLTGAPVQPRCLEIADRRFLELVVDAGPGCADAGLVVEMGVRSDATMSEIVGAVDISSPSIPDVSGLWELRTVTAVNPDREEDGSLYCDFEPPCADELAIVRCEIEIEQEGEVFEQSGRCWSAEESQLEIDPFRLSGVGTIDPSTGETFMEGEVEVQEGFFVYFKGEGAFAEDGMSSTMTTTAGVQGNWQWLSVTTGRHLDEAAE